MFGIVGVKNDVIFPIKSISAVVACSVVVFVSLNQYRSAALNGGAQPSAQGVGQFAGLAAERLAAERADMEASKAEMAALLSDINQAGLGRSLQFDLFRPGQVVVKEYYAELPIQIRVTGKYHDMGSFASDIAHLSRIVTLNNISIAPLGKEKGGAALTMEATARTFRYLDSEEIQAQKQVAKGEKK